MKLGSRDRKYHILITGEELKELKKYTWAMIEAFGLDHKVENYKGKRPIGFWPWDLDCLEAVLDSALDDYDKQGKEYKAMKKLYSRICALREEAYSGLRD